MSQTSAAALNESALTDLNSALEQSATPADFLAQADEIVANPDNRLELPTDLSEPDPIQPLTGTSGVDVANGPAVFEYIGPGLDASNAADPRLWTFLAFSTYRPYMEKRWPLAGEKWQSRAGTRWLLRGSPTRGKLVRHGIARLWWVTNLTFDPRCEYPLSQASGDPYAYTRAVFRNEDRINALFDREIGAISSVTRAVLEHAATDSATGRDKYVRAVMKELTLIMGFRDLGLLSSADLNELIKEIRPRADSDDTDEAPFTEDDA